MLSAGGGTQITRSVTDLRFSRCLARVRMWTPHHTLTLNFIGKVIVGAADYIRWGHIRIHRAQTTLRAARRTGPLLPSAKGSRALNSTGRFVFFRHVGAFFADRFVFFQGVLSSFRQSRPIYCDITRRDLLEALLSKGRHFADSPLSGAEGRRTEARDPHRCGLEQQQRARKNLPHLPARTTPAAYPIMSVQR